MSAAPDSAGLFAQKTDAELLYLIQEPGRYPVPVVQAAVRELQRRGLIPEELPAADTAQPPGPESAPEPGGWALLREAGRGIFRPRPGYFITPILLWLNVLVYALMVLSGTDPLSPAGADLVRWGANYSPLTLPGQPWRLLTACFLHGGPAHLLLNMASLVFLGLMTESLMSRRRFLLVYLSSGVGGSLASLWWHAGGVLSVGASGAIFGLYGLLLATLAVRPTAFDRAGRRTVLLFMVYLLASSLAGGLETHTTDNAAHVGGLLMGLLLGAAAPRRQPR